MNFKKGSQITRAALTKENMKSANILKTLPINMDKEDQVTDMLWATFSNWMSSSKKSKHTLSISVSAICLYYFRCSLL